MEFVEAIETLAGTLGLEVPAKKAAAPARPKAAGLESLYQTMENCSELLPGSSCATVARAVDYLKNRGISGQTAKDLRHRLRPARLEQSSTATTQSCWSIPA